MQSPDANWYQVCKECYQCESSLLSELYRVSVAGHTVNLLDEQQLRPFAKLPHRAELVHLMLTDILDKSLWLVSCSNFTNLCSICTLTKYLYWISVIVHMYIYCTCNLMFCDYKAFMDVMVLSIHKSLPLNLHNI